MTGTQARGTQFRLGTQGRLSLTGSQARDHPSHLLARDLACQSAALGRLSALKGAIGLGGLESNSSMTSQLSPPESFSSLTLHIREDCPWETGELRLQTAIGSYPGSQVSHRTSPS